MIFPSSFGWWFVLSIHICPSWIFRVFGIHLPQDSWAEEPWPIIEGCRPVSSERASHTVLLLYHDLFRVVLLWQGFYSESLSWDAFVQLSVCSYCVSGAKLACGNISQFSSVTQSCPVLCDPVDCSMPGFPIHHQLPELTQTHVHWVGDAIQPSHPLLSPSPPAFNPKGNQFWIFIGRTDVEVETPILWLHDANNWFIGKDWERWEMLGKIEGRRRRGQ